MSLLPNGYNPQTLEDSLNTQATSAANNLTDEYTQSKKRLVAQQAAGGRLMSGVSNYPLTDLGTNYTKGLSGIQDSLSGALAGVPEEDWLNQQEYGRNEQLAKLIGSLNKPSTLQEVLSGIGTAGSIGAAAFGAF